MTRCTGRPYFSVHPHTRGEYVFLNRARGIGDRFTPTRVGNTSPVVITGGILPRFTPTRVGNTAVAVTSLLVVFGSPPHAWGIRGVAV